MVNLTHIRQGFDIWAAGTKRVQVKWDNDNSRLSWYVGSTEIARMDATTGLSSLLPSADSFTGSITAFAGGGQASATALTTRVNDVTTVASNFDSVKLPVPVAGQVVTVRNSGAAILSVFPSTGLTINGLAANLSIDVAIGASVAFTAISATAWKTSTTLSLPAPSTQKGSLALKAADNSGNTQTIITNASQAAARTYTIPDAGASANFVMSEGAATVNGVKTFGSMPVIPRATLAATGSVLADAAQLVAGFTSVTAADGTKGVKLPATPAAGTVCIVKSVTGGSILKVWPDAAATINAIGANGAISMASLTSAIFVADSTTQWYTLPLLPS